MNRCTFYSLGFYGIVDDLNFRGVDLKVVGQALSQALRDSQNLIGSALGDACDPLAKFGKYWVGDVVFEHSKSVVALSENPPGVFSTVECQGKVGGDIHAHRETEDDIGLEFPQHSVVGFENVYNQSRIGGAAQLGEMSLQQVVGVNSF